MFDLDLSRRYGFKKFVIVVLAGVLADAQVDLNPHQIEAALFALGVEHSLPRTKDGPRPPKGRPVR
jgi:hypothetical protein